MKKILIIISIAVCLLVAGVAVTRPDVVKFGGTETILNESAPNSTQAGGKSATQNGLENATVPSGVASLQPKDANEAAKAALVKSWIDESGRGQAPLVSWTGR